MNINSSQSVQTSHNPLNTSIARRIQSLSPAASPSLDKAADKKAEKQQQQQDEEVLRRLRARDREVRAHENAHIAAAGELVRGGPSYTLQQGPDGRSYAIGGEVQLDVSEVPDDPEATVNKSERVRRAALAPAQPSPQDFRVAGSANQMAARARIDIAVQRSEQAQQALEAKTEQAENPAEARRDPENNPSDNPRAVDPSADTAAQAELQSNDPPVAAISNFMATAQSEIEAVQISRFA